MSKEKPKLMYSDKEIELIKAVFCENEGLLKALRKLFFGLEMSAEEKSAIKAAFTDKNVLEVFRRKVYNNNNFDTPIGQISDFWIGVEQQIFGASRDTIFQAVESKKLVFAMFEKAFRLIENPDCGEKISVKDFQSVLTDPLQVELLARNLYMKAVETALLTVQTIAGKKGETLEETLKRIQQDSNK